MFTIIAVAYFIVFFTVWGLASLCEYLLCKILSNFIEKRS